MSWRFCLVTVLVVVAILACSFPQISRVYASNPTIYLQPSTINFTTANASVGTLFNVSAWVSNAPDLGGAEVYMEFNDSIINCTRCIVPDTDPNFFMPEPPAVTVLPAPPDPGYVHLASGLGSVDVAVSKGGLPPVAPWGHSGLILTYEFNVTAVPPAGENLTCSLHMNSTSNTFLLDSAGNDVPNVEIVDSTYTLASAAVPEFPIGLLLLVFLGLTVTALVVRKKIPTRPNVKSL